MRCLPAVDPQSGSDPSCNAQDRFKCFLSAVTEMTDVSLSRML